MSWRQSFRKASRKPWYYADHMSKYCTNTKKSLSKLSLIGFLSRPEPPSFMFQFWTSGFKFELFLIPFAVFCF